MSSRIVLPIACGVWVLATGPGFVLGAAAEGSPPPAEARAGLSGAFLDVRSWGAAGDGLHDDTAAIQAAIDSRQGIVLVPRGTYRLTRPLEMRSGVSLQGVGPASLLLQMADGQPILRASGERIHVSRLKLAFARPQGRDQPGGVGIEIGRLYESVLEQLHIDGAHTGIWLGSRETSTHSAGAVPEVKFLYSCSIRDLRISRFSGYGLHLHPVNAGATGCLFSNIYLVNWKDYGRTRYRAIGGALFQNFSESVVSQLNVEHSVLDTALTINNCETFNLQSLHVEGIEAREDYAAVFNVIGSNVVLSTATVQFSKIEAPRYALFRVLGASTLHARNVRTRALDAPPGSRWLFYSTDPKAVIYADDVVSDFFRDLALPDTNPPVLRRLNDQVFHLRLGAASVSVTSGRPRRGSWRLGDVALAESGERDGLIGWICVRPGRFGGDPADLPVFRALGAYGGSSAARPQPGVADAGLLYWDATLGALLVWDGVAWRRVATGGDTGEGQAAPSVRLEGGR